MTLAIILGLSIVAAVYLVTNADVTRARIHAGQEVDLARMRRLSEEQEAALRAEIAALRLEHDKLVAKVAGMRTSRAFGG